MGRSEAVKRSQAAYLKRQRDSGKFTQFVLRFSEDNQDAYQWLKAQPNMTAYIIGLIRKDMEGGN